ncbi:uncharacterized protein [Aegilops tauschii subsp. strangulata]|uniref:uncharacterized protein n=1 Tax=Aegilops tauschii subsp. strangulata TaxID=200361 RepID=UPI003CC86565
MEESVLARVGKKLPVAHGGLGGLSHPHSAAATPKIPLGIHPQPTSLLLPDPSNHHSPRRPPRSPRREPGRGAPCRLPPPRPRAHSRGAVAVTPRPAPLCSARLGPVTPRPAPLCSARLGPAAGLDDLKQARPPERPSPEETPCRLRPCHLRPDPEVRRPSPSPQSRVAAALLRPRRVSRAPELHLACPPPRPHGRSNRTGGRAPKPSSRAPPPSTSRSFFVSLVAVTCPLLPSFSCSSSPLSLIPLVFSLTRRASCRQHRRRWTPDAQIRSPSLPRRRPCRRRLHRFLTRTAPLQFVSSASLCPIWSPLTASIGWVTAAQAQLPSPASPAPRVPAGPICRCR